jgi:hypothetical protein
MSTSPITAAKNAQGYLAATQRKRCGTCQFSQEAYGSSWQCRKGGFMVTVYSVCNEWMVRQPPGFKVPPL